MPRKARKDLDTTFIHVMVQGVNKEYIFDDERFLRKYLVNIKTISDREQFDLLAYCMMNNHAHFLFWVKNFVEFENYMHKNNLFFAQDYNKEKSRCGVVFRNRYHVEPIYKMNHLVNCIKYIHNNPVKAEMVEKCEDYPFSSYAEYANQTGVAKSKILKEVFGDIENYLDVIEQSCDRRFVDYEDDKNVNKYIESGISEFMKKFHNGLVEIFCERGKLTELILFLKEECNISYKEIMEYFEISRGVFNHILKEINLRRCVILGEKRVKKGTPSEITILVISEGVPFFTKMVISEGVPKIIPKITKSSPKNSWNFVNYMLV